MTGSHTRLQEGLGGSRSRSTWRGASAGLGGAGENDPQRNVTFSSDLRGNGMQPGERVVGGGVQVGEHSICRDLRAMASFQSSLGSIMARMQVTVGSDRR